MSTEQKLGASVEKPFEAPKLTPEVVAAQIAEASAVASLEALEVTPEIEGQKSPEQDPDAIAQKYLEQIPETDRRPISVDDMTFMMYILVDGAYGTAGNLSTYDRFGNLPKSVLDLFMKSDRVGVVDALRAFSNDPLAHVHELDKLGTNFWNKVKNVPDSVKKAIASIALIEGIATTQQGMGEVAERIVASPEQDISSIIVEYKTKRSADFQEGDSIRRVAIGKLFEGLYPELTSSPEIKALATLKKLASEETEEETGLRARINHFFAETASTIPGFSESPILKTDLQALPLAKLQRLVHMDLPKAIKMHLAQRFGEK